MAEYAFGTEKNYMGRKSANKMRIMGTRKGEPIALVTPPPPPPKPKVWLGSLKDTVKITGDIISPALDEKDSMGWNQNNHTEKSMSLNVRLWGSCGVLKNPQALEGMILDTASRKDDPEVLEGSELIPP